ncbi:hypothetical protein F4703DRAFT_1241941 [Phycomyces blakesleeanus]
MELDIERKKRLNEEAFLQDLTRKLNEEMDSTNTVWEKLMSLSPPTPTTSTSTPMHTPQPQSQPKSQPSSPQSRSRSLSQSQPQFKVQSNSTPEELDCVTIKTEELDPAENQEFKAEIEQLKERLDIYQESLKRIQNGLAESVRQKETRAVLGQAQNTVEQNSTDMLQLKNMTRIYSKTIKDMQKHAKLSEAVLVAKDHQLSKLRQSSIDLELKIEETVKTLKLSQKANGNEKAMLNAQLEQAKAEMKNNIEALHKQASDTESNLRSLLAASDLNMKNLEQNLSTERTKLLVQINLLKKAALSDKEKASEKIFEAESKIAELSNQIIIERKIAEQKAQLARDEASKENSALLSKFDFSESMVVQLKRLLDSKAYEATLSRSIVFPTFTPVPPSTLSNNNHGQFNQASDTTTQNNTQLSDKRHRELGKEIIKNKEVYEADKKTLEERLQQSQSIITILKHKMDGAHNTFQDEIKHHAEANEVKVLALNEKIDSLKNCISQLDNKIKLEAAKNKKKTGLEEDVKSTRVADTCINEKRFVLKKPRTDKGPLLEDIEMFEHHKKAYEEEKELVLKEKVKLQYDNKVYRQQLEIAQSSIQQIEDKFFQERLQFEKEMEKLRQENAEEMKTLNANLDKTLGKYLEAQSQLTDRNKAHFTEIAAWKKSNIDEKKIHGQHIDQLNARYNILDQESVIRETELRAQIASERKTHKKEKEELEDKVKLLMTELTKTQFSLHTINSQVENFELTKQNLEYEKRMVELELQKAESDLEKLEQSIPKPAALGDENDDAVSKMISIEAMEDERKAYKETLNQSATRLIEAEKEWGKKEARLLAQIDLLKVQNSEDRKRSVDELRDSGCAMALLAKEAFEKKRELETEIESLLKHIEIKKRLHSASLEKAEAEFAYLKKEITEKNSLDLDGANNLYKTAQTKIHDLEIQLKAAQLTITQLEKKHNKAKFELENQIMDLEKMSNETKTILQRKLKQAEYEVTIFLGQLEARIGLSRNPTEEEMNAIKEISEKL